MTTFGVIVLVLTSGVENINLLCRYVSDFDQDLLV